MCLVSISTLLCIVMTRKPDLIDQIGLFQSKIYLNRYLQVITNYEVSYTVHIQSNVIKQFPSLTRSTHDTQI